MALINCEECGNEVSNKAAACPKCGCPTPKTAGEGPAGPPEIPSTAKGKVDADGATPPPIERAATPPPPPPAQAAPAGDGPNKNNSLIIGLVGGAIGIVLLLALFAGGGGRVHVTELTSDSPLFGTPTVRATLVNEGRSGTLIYYVTLGNSSTRHCRGSVYVAQNERRRISFGCPALIGYNGNFTLRAGPE